MWDIGDKQKMISLATTRPNNFPSMPVMNLSKLCTTVFPGLITSLFRLKLRMLVL